VPLTLGNIDKNALEAGVNLKEAADAKLIVVSAGNEELEDTIRKRWLQVPMKLFGDRRRAGQYCQ
jgi:electron transfer flavoprotein alpha/beta subunit